MKNLFCLCFCFFSLIDTRATPNILLIISEDNGPELGCYGEPFVKTPNLDRLAEEGILFENAYVPQAGCSQSRASLLTGLYPHQNGQIGLATWKFRMYSKRTPNLISVFKQFGYRTGIIGKLHVNPEEAFPFDFKKIPSANFSRKNLEEYSQFAEEFINASEMPFFLSVNYPDPHRPFLRQVNKLPPMPLTSEDVKPLGYFGLDHQALKEDTANYYNSLSRLDSLIGDLLSALDHSGKSKNTIVVYLGDHGADMLRGKRTSYEGGLKIPLIIRCPEIVRPNRSVRELTSTIDLFPTFLDIVGIKPEFKLPGRSLMPLIKNREIAWREYIFTEYHTHSAHNYYPQRTIRNNRFKLILNLQPNEINPGYEFTKSKFYVDLDEIINEAPEHIKNAYVLMEKPPEFQLYDLHTDPFEFKNLAESSEHKGILALLKEQLNLWRHKTKDPLLNIANVKALKREINACKINGKYKKNRLQLNYDKYFFE